MRPRVRRSRPGFWVAGVFLATAATVFCIHTVSVHTNVANSGESGILLLPFALPWILWLPEAVIRTGLWNHPALPGWWLLVLVNAGILYAVFGGLR